MLDIAVLVSGGGTNLQAIIDRISDGDLSGVRIVGVVASRSGTMAEQRAVRANIPVKIVCRKDFPDPEAYDRAMIAALSDWKPELIVLAGFLNLLGPTVVAAWRNRIVNVHPSLIPSFCGPGYYGIRPHEAVLASGACVTGATVHIVDEEYDRGPIILQKTVPVHADDTPQTLQLRVMQEAEQVILPKAIALFAAGRIQIEDRKVIILGGTEND
ncbi:MAG: phosphoribosylglycinamide formyltransferase [Clostridiaceae bacterium]|nr:phosphoribosylglycinamide formyltransferase [Clostridiaceae bacterium]